MPFESDDRSHEDRDVVARIRIAARLLAVAALAAL